MLLVSLSLPPTVVHDSSSLVLPSASRVSSRPSQPQQLAFNSIVEGESVPAILDALREQFLTQLPSLFQGVSLTYCLYGSLASLAQSLFLDYQDTYESLDASLGSSFASLLLQEVSNQQWSLGVSSFMIQDNAVFDVLSGKEKRSVMDSGSILFMKGMKCYEVASEEELKNVLRTVQQTVTLPLPTNAAIVLLFQLITPQKEYAARMTVILLPPCDKTTPYMVTQTRIGASLRFRKNQDMTSALMVGLRRRGEA